MNQVPISESNPPPGNPRLRTPAAAQYCSLSDGWMRQLRCKGGGPRFERVGARTILYPIDELDRWLSANGRLPSTSAPGAKNPSHTRTP
jgi:hypothetical protein